MIADMDAVKVSTQNSDPNIRNKDFFGEA